MKKSDFLWVLMLVGFTSLVLIESTREVYESWNSNMPYLMGFIKTAFLASMGERLVHRMKYKTYFGDSGIILKAIVWGFLGMVFVLIFQIFSQGVIYSQNQQLLPMINQTSFWGALLTAFLTSTLMNIFFAPTFMMLHRISDGYIELSSGNFKKMRNIKFDEVISKIDFKMFISFVVIKTIPLFWIPAHTITFLLQPQYRVLFASYLSIALGIILTFAKTKKVEGDHI
ncbi:MAG: hypothetical protein V3569_04080 [Acholeplasmataceae bacterium]|nr:Mpv17/PMP22 family protein [Acholeplasmataceae bacterium]